MTQHFLTVNGEGLHGSEKKSYIIKSYSFTTDDDEPESKMNCQSISNHDKLLSINSPSIDSNSNTNDDDVSESSTKLTKRKSRRSTETRNHIEEKSPSIKKHPWYKKIDFSKPLMIVGVLILLYLMWVKRDVWIYRLLTSNARIRRSAIEKLEQTGEESIDSPLSSTSTTSSILSKDFSSDSSHNEDFIENPEEEDDTESNNEDSTASTKSTSTGKINIRIRRNKMSFSQKNPKKKRDRLQNLSVDDNLDEEEQEEEDKSIETNDSTLPSTKKHQHGIIIPNKTSKNIFPIDSPLRLSNYNHIIEQLRTNLKSRIENRDFLSNLSKTTGLNKNKLYRFIFKKDYQLIKLQTFISILDSFNLTILIVTK